MDLAYMALFTIALDAAIRYLIKPNFLSAIICGIACGLAIDVRNTGIVIPVMVAIVNIIQGLRHELYWNKIYKNLLLFIGSTCLISFLFWPWLWSDPIQNFYSSLKVLSKISVSLDLLYLGQVISATNIPWHYSLVWIVISTPLLYLLLFSLGSYSTLIDICKKNIRLWKTPDELQDWIFFAIFFCPIIAVIVLHSVLYDGWRHLYFIYPAFLLLALKGCVCLWSYCISKFRKIFFIGLISTNLVWILIWMIQTHPLQNVFFNKLVPPGWNKQFEVDYWGMSMKQGLNFITTIDKRAAIEILPGGLMNIDLASKILDPNDAKRIIEASNNKYFDYYITTFRSNPLKFIPPQLILIKEFYVQGETVLAIYKNQTQFMVNGLIYKGRAILFSSPDISSSELLPSNTYIIYGDGWSKPEPWGTWSNNHKATLIFQKTIFNSTFQPSSLTLNVKGFISDIHPLQKVKIYANGIYLKEAILDKVGPQLLTLKLPNISFPEGTLEIMFELNDAVSPKTLGLNLDQRLLALGLISITFN
jgi:hypothetical protein